MKAGLMKNGEAEWLDYSQMMLHHLSLSLQYLTLKNS